MSEVKSNEIIISKRDIKNSKKNSNFKAISPAEIVKKNITFAITRDGGKYIDCNGEYGIMLCGATENNNYGFLIIDKDRNIKFIDSTVRYKLLKEFPNDLSVLSYVYSHNAYDLKERVEAQIENSDYETFTPLKLKLPVRNNNSKKNNSKKTNKKSTNKK